MSIITAYCDIDCFGILMPILQIVTVNKDTHIIVMYNYTVISNFTSACEFNSILGLLLVTDA